MKAKAVPRRRLVRMGRKQLYHMRIVVVRFFQIMFVASIESSIHG